MFGEHSVVCTICARGGSKGIPGKNKRVIAGKPLIQYTLETARACPFFDRIVVSTDDEEIRAAVNRWGPYAPFVRPAHLSTDDSSKIDVIRHAVVQAEESRETFDLVVDLSVVSPLRSVGDIAGVIRILVEEGADNVFSVSPPYRNPYYNMVEESEGTVRLVREPGRKLTRRQDAPRVYDMNDSIFAWKREILFGSDTTFNRRTRMYLMPRERGIDMDEPVDLAVVTLILEHRDRFDALLEDFGARGVPP